ncbi:MAG: hypothetical protein KF791_08235 [Verrucomicrobiae bacterium]|nr:hypothetical protein [Verrucomicrobiae bacterium]
MQTASTNWTPGRRRVWWTALPVTLLAAIAVATLAPVDLDPQLSASWRMATEARLSASETSSGVATASLRAGFARTRLTPALGVSGGNPALGEFDAIPLAGYGNRKGQPATGVLDDVWVKAVAFAVAGRTGVVVSADALIIPREVALQATDAVTAATGLRRDQIFFGATHTHCSLGGWGEGPVGQAFAGPFHPGAVVWFAGQLAAAVREAVADLTPASLGTGGFEAPEWVRNRLVGEQGPVDARFSLIRVRQEDGDEAVIGSYGAHATVLGASTMRFSGDYPGAWQRTMERNSGGLALFLAGAVGSQGPRTPVGGPDGATAMGEALATASRKALAEISMSQEVIFGQASVEVGLPELQNRILDGVRLRPWLARRLLPPLAADVWIQAVRIQDAVWCSTPCDYSGELALALRGDACLRGLDAVVTSFNGDYIGYVIPGKYFHLGGYESRVMSFYGPNIPDYFDGVLRRLMHRLSPAASDPVVNSGPGRH